MDPVQDGRKRHSEKTQIDGATSHRAREATASGESAEPKKYKLDPRIVEAHLDYEEWLELGDEERDALGIQGDVLNYFLRKYQVP